MQLSFLIQANSRIVNALVRAAENGKEVFVVVELRARFDEQHNIDCSKKLEEAGCTVIYGVEHYKVHSKLMVLTYRKHNKIQYITQIGTGNYNEKTALFVARRYNVILMEITEESVAACSNKSLIEDMIAHYMPQIFNEAVEESFVFRVTRNGDMEGLQSHQSKKKDPTVQIL